MFNSKLLLIADNQGKVGLSEFPAKLDYPAKKTLGNKTYYDTGKYRTTFEYGKARIYTEMNSNVNLDILAVDLTEVKEAPKGE